MIDVRIILFDDFETLDAFGPAEVFGRLPETYRVRCFSQKGGIITSSQNVQVQTEALDATTVAKPPHHAHAAHSHTLPKESAGRTILLIPGGQGTRTLVNDTAFTDRLAMLTKGAWRVLSVCTGSALLAQTGLLDGLPATTNKRAFDWVASVRPQVGWQRSARWVRSGHIYTSSGVSAGIDMSLGFIADHKGLPTARTVATGIEYIWNEDSTNDPF